MSKIRRVDYSPDEMIAGVAGQLSPVEFGVYWMICTLIYSRGEAIADDPEWLAGVFRKTNPRTVRSALDRLVEIGKVERNDGELMVNRCRIELERASNRTRKAAENGAKGGRPSNKNKEIPKPEAFQREKLTINEQPSTNNQDDDDTRARDVRRVLDALADFGMDPVKDPRYVADREVRLWVNGGADVDLDILPTIRDLMARKRDGPPGSFSYFTNAIRVARERRIANAKPIEGSNHETARAQPVQRGRDSRSLAAGLAAAVAGGVDVEPNAPGSDRDHPRRDC